MSAVLLLSNCRGNGLHWTKGAVMLLFSCDHLLYSLGGGCRDTDQPGSNVVSPQNEHQPCTHVLIYCPLQPVRLSDTFGSLQYGFIDCRCLLKLDILSLHQCCAKMLTFGHGHAGGLSGDVGGMSSLYSDWSTMCSSGRHSIKRISSYWRASRRGL